MPAEETVYAFSDIYRSAVSALNSLTIAVQNISEIFDKTVKVGLKIIILLAFGFIAHMLTMVCWVIWI